MFLGGVVIKTWRQGGSSTGGAQVGLRALARAVRRLFATQGAAGPGHLEVQDGWRAQGGVGGSAPHPEDTPRCRQPLSSQVLHLDSLFYYFGLPCYYDPLTMQPLTCKRGGPVHAAGPTAQTPVELLRGTAPPASASPLLRTRLGLVARR